MSQIEYFATFDESIEILRALTVEGLQVIVQPEFADTPHATTFTSVDDTVTRILERAPGFFLAGPFTRQEVAFMQLSGGTANGKFAINWLAGGPILQCLAARVGEVDGVPCLLPGDFSYQDAYRNLNTNEWEKPTADLKGAFRKITSLVKARCPAFEYKPGSTVFIAPKARAMLEANTVTISAD
ncbi:MAG: hypothetical protein ABI591_34135 [Kofleriaceae bacterium]